MDIIDGHVHIFSQINGANLLGPTKGCGFGYILSGGEKTPFMPPFSEGTAFSEEALHELMLQNGVKKAVLFQNPTIGSVNEEIAEAVGRYPERYAGLMQVDPFDAAAPAAARRLAETRLFRGIKFEMSRGWGWTGIHGDRSFSYADLRPFMLLAREFGLVVAFDTGDTSSPAYLPGELDRLTSEFCDVVFVIEHGGYPTPDGDRQAWRRMVNIAVKDNVYLGVCAIPTLMGSAAAKEILHLLYEAFGPDKLIWGTDGPCTLRQFTYRQLIDLVLADADFLSQRAKAKLLYSNADKVYFQ